ncbi:uncharacterized protein K460DRAFT_295962 [Cucurbitaria berberidis CBS 394.84]|uniref:Uncharacterized protein n=1 Tax=Cucurbitaria berberidis CBS 394.84 TaxID=1168544 RepID=A0A9P4G8E7_9PLEO|nr:uncharacterized protein K460DRAFT_295962 [Cucurbitaria berberidis CBS 394.84]KAF1840973.1 hypothetical protein K460DRAFT_295962 [Cucurbitaria berberidis CBS 394.84]
MAAVAMSRAVPYGPRSPTLSDAGMILPHETRFERSVSPPPYIERPPSPPVLYADSSHIKPSSAPQSRRRASQHNKSTPLSSRSSRSTLRAMASPEAVAKGATVRDDALASSPTIHNALSSHLSSNWNDQRRLSTASSSVLSEDFENWPGFDSHQTYNDGGVDLEKKGKRDHFPDDSDIGDDDDMGNESWQNERNSGSDEDDGPYSSAALSRRAEIILANAKKRLNVMEGNLRGARESLVVSPTLGVPNNSSDLSQHISAARERDRRLYAGIGPIPPRIYSYRPSPLSPSSSSGHLRGVSETSVPIPFTPSYISRNATTNKRASSAIGHTTGPWSHEGYGQGRFPIKESRSVEVLRDPRNTWGTAERESVVRSTSRSSRSPPALETLPEDEAGSELRRSASAASGLRDQMNDLKGRISSLKLKAQEDHLRRRSIQSLRTPSPFTSAETWYSGTNAHQSGGSPVTANAGLGIKIGSPTRTAMYEDDYNQTSSPRTTTSQKEGEKLVTYNDESETLPKDDDAEETDEGDFVSVNGDDLEPGADSVYEDAVYEMPATERHEDRVDAFDYENFFLHSAMGTYSLEGRRSSTSSGSSTATTRPVTAVQTSEELSSTEKRISYHQRTSSVDSVSTVATFATAAEEQSDDEEENEQMDQFSQQILSSQHPITSRPGLPNGLASLRSDSAINMRRGNGSSPTQTSISRGSSSPADFAGGLQTSKIFSILTEASRDEPRLALSEEETQLIYGLAASFQQVCANLQNTYGEAYERKAWRRRLDEARRVLSGEELDDDQSF